MAAKWRRNVLVVGVVLLVLCAFVGVKADKTTTTTTTTADKGSLFESIVQWASLKLGFFTPNHRVVAVPANNKFRVQLMEESRPGPKKACTPGAPQFGKRDFIEYIPGCGPIVLSAPHGGYERPSDIPDRTSGTTVQDSYTQELIRTLADNMEQLTSPSYRPHVIINRLHRIKLDANREIVEAAQGDPQAEQAWIEYQGFIDQAKAEIQAAYGRGLYVDIHGNGHPEQWIEIGYLLTAEQLDTISDAEMSTSQVINQTSIRTRGTFLQNDRGIPFSEFLRGSQSLGGLLQRKSYKTTPSDIYPGPAGGNYFSGGYCTERHGSYNGGLIDGLQIELNPDVRFEEPARIEFTKYLAECLLEYYNTYWS